MSSINITGDGKIQGKNIETIEEVGSNFIRYGSGLQVLMWKETAGSSSGVITHNLPKPFLNTDYSVVFSLDDTGTTNLTRRVMARLNPTTTSFQSYSSGLTKIFIAAGKWK